MTAGPLLLSHSQAYAWDVQEQYKSHEVETFCITTNMFSVILLYKKISEHLCIVMLLKEYKYDKNNSLWYLNTLVNTPVKQ